MLLKLNSTGNYEALIFVSVLSFLRYGCANILYLCLEGKSSDLHLDNILLTENSCDTSVPPGKYYAFKSTFLSHSYLLTICN